MKINRAGNVIDQSFAGKTNSKEVSSLTQEKNIGLIARDVAIVEADMDLLNKEANEEAAQDYLRIII